MEGDSTFDGNEFQNDWQEIERTEQLLNGLEGKVKKFKTANESLDEPGQEDLFAPMNMKMLESMDDVKQYLPKSVKVSQDGTLVPNVSLMYQSGLNQNPMLDLEVMLPEQDIVDDVIMKNDSSNSFQQLTSSALSKQIKYKPSKITTQKKRTTKKSSKRYSKRTSNRKSKEAITQFTPELVQQTNKLLSRKPEKTDPSLRKIEKLEQFYKKKIRLLNERVKIIEDDRQTMVKTLKKVQKRVMKREEKYQEQLKTQEIDQLSVFNNQVKLKNEILNEKIKQFEKVQTTMQEMQVENEKLQKKNYELEHQLSEYQKDTSEQQKKYGKLMQKHNKYIELDLKRNQDSLVLSQTQRKTKARVSKEKHLKFTKTLSNYKGQLTDLKRNHEAVSKEYERDIRYLEGQLMEQKSQNDQKQQVINQSFNPFSPGNTQQTQMHHDSPQTVSLFRLKTGNEEMPTQVKLQYKTVEDRQLSNREHISDLNEKSRSNIKQLNNLYDEIFKEPTPKAKSFKLPDDSPLKREFSAHLRQRPSSQDYLSLEKLDEVKTELKELKNIVQTKIQKKKWKKFRKSDPQRRGRSQGRKSTDRVKRKKRSKRKAEIEEIDTMKCIWK